jgi:hypothetical protein
MVNRFADPIVVLPDGSIHQLDVGAIDRACTKCHELYRE